MPALSLLPSYPGRDLLRPWALSKQRLKGAGIAPPNNPLLDANSVEIRDTGSGDNFS